ncbi:hypothetical protein GJAV_G00084550 [Gymnothorax javanicus]|nr:hypothetical protein GJAV_G00084550 [Gymnothorax javanicus]
MLTSCVLACILVWNVAMTNGRIPDERVTCQFSEDCLLPCSFKPANEEVISWSRQEVAVHSFAQGRDQPEGQHAHYRGRTAMFPQRVTHGNASLLLKQCNTQDRGRYRCWVRTALGVQESFVIAKVEAPAQALTLEMTQLSGYEELKCSAQDVYPAPHVSWFTVPSEPLDTLKPITRKMANKNGLYSVESKLRKLPEKDSRTYTYFCTVNSSYNTRTWRASLQEKELSSETGGELTIPCRAPTALHNFTLTWTFTRADFPEEVFTFHSRTGRTSNQWAVNAWVNHDLVPSGDGSLHLWDLQAEEHTGTYTCTFSTSQNRHMVRTSVNITAAAAAERQSASSSSWLWVIAVALAALVALVTALCLCRKKRDDQSPRSKPAEVATEMQAVPTDDRENGIQSENCSLTKDPNNECS